MAQNDYRIVKYSYIAYLQVIALLAAVQEADVDAVRVVVGGGVGEGGQRVACLRIDTDDVSSESQMDLEAENRTATDLRPPVLLGHRGGIVDDDDGVISPEDLERVLVALLAHRPTEVRQPLLLGRPSWGSVHIYSTGCRCHQTTYNRGWWEGAIYVHLGSTVIANWPLAERVPAPRRVL